MSKAFCDLEKNLFIVEMCCYSCLLVVGNLILFQLPGEVTTSDFYDSSRSLKPTDELNTILFLAGKVNV
jgi:hypothetical protein